MYVCTYEGEWREREGGGGEGFKCTFAILNIYIWTTA